MPISGKSDGPIVHCPCVLARNHLGQPPLLSLDGMNGSRVGFGLAGFSRLLNRLAELRNC